MNFLPGRVTVAFSWFTLKCSEACFQCATRLLFQVEAQPAIEAIKVKAQPARFDFVLFSYA